MFYIDFLKDLINGVKRHIKSKDIQHLNVPHYETLTINHILEKFKNHKEFHEHLPDKQEITKLPK